MSTSKREPRGAARHRRNQTIKPDRVAAVVRVSKVDGREGDSFMSPDEQRDKISAYCARRGIDVVAWFDELDMSGDTTEREGLQAALDLVYAGAADGLIVATVDRFARSLVQGLLAVYRLKENSKAFIAVRENIGESARADKVLLEDHLKMAERQLDNITESWMDTRRRFVANGVSLTAPFGYRKHPETRRLVPDPDTAPWVEQVFRWRIDGWSYARIGRALDAAGVVSPRGGHWTNSSVKGLVQRRTYRGELSSGTDYDGTPIVNTEAHPPLVSESLWQAAQQMRQTPAPGTRTPYPLAGLVRCASCGARMTGLRATKRTTTKTWRYYRCTKRFSWGHCPAPARIRAEELEAYVYERFERDYLSRRRWMGRPKHGPDLAAAQSALDEANAMYDRFLTAPSTIELEMSTDPRDQERVEAAKRARRAKIADAKAALAKLQREAGELPGVPTDVAQLWPTLDDEARRGLLSVAYAVIAVRRALDSDDVSIVDRVRIWSDDDDGCPVGLPGRDTHVDKLVPIVW